MSSKHSFLSQLTHSYTLICSLKRLPGLLQEGTQGKCRIQQTFINQVLKCNLISLYLAPSNWIVSLGFIYKYLFSTENVSCFKAPIWHACKKIACDNVFQTTVPFQYKIRAANCLPDLFVASCCTNTSLLNNCSTARNQKNCLIHKTLLKRAWSEHSPSLQGVAK